MGLGIALAALSRAEADRLFPFLAVPFAYLVDAQGRRQGAMEAGTKYALAACVAGGLLMLPWVAYNLTRFDHPVVDVERRRQRADGRRTATRRPDRRSPKPGVPRHVSRHVRRLLDDLLLVRARRRSSTSFYSPDEGRRLQGAARLHPRHRLRLLRRRVDARGRVARGRHRRDEGPPGPDAVAGRAARRAHVGLLPARAEHLPQRRARRPRRVAVAARDVRVLPAAAVRDPRPRRCCAGAGCRSCRSSRSRCRSRSPRRRPSASRATARPSTRCCPCSRAARSCGCSSTPGRWWQQRSGAAQPAAVSP